MIRFCFVVALVTLICAAPAAFASQCYSSREVEAEQGLRIHSELMVISLTCMKMPQGQDMYRKYQAFTQKNRTLLSRYEMEIINYYRSAGEAKPEQQFHSLRTNLANGISQHAIRMSTASFCKQFSTRIDNALEMDEDKLRRWAQHVWPDSPTSRPVCGGLKS